MPCTNVLSDSLSYKMIIGHNEDWIPAMAGKDVVVCASIAPYETADGRHFPAEKFVVHTWPG